MYIPKIYIFAENYFNNDFMKEKTIYSIKVRHNKVVNCCLHIKYVRLIDEDDEGRQYSKTVKYMENTVTTSCKLSKLLINATKPVRTLIDYIINHLSYNQTVIELKNKNIACETGIDQSDITKAIKYLSNKDVDVIRRMREIEGYENDNMFSQYDYFVNPEYIFHGSINSLTK